MKNNIAIAAVKISPEKFAWMKYKGTVSKILRHTKRNGDVVISRLNTGDVYGYREVRQRSTGKTLIQIVLKSDGMDLTYNILEKPFYSKVLKNSRTTVMPKMFRKAIDTGATEKVKIEPKTKTKIKLSPLDKFLKTLSPKFLENIKGLEKKYNVNLMDQHDLESILMFASKLNVTPEDITFSILASESPDLKSAVMSVVDQTLSWSLLTGKNVDYDKDLGDGYVCNIKPESTGYLATFIAPPDIKAGELIAWRTDLDDLYRQLEQTKIAHQTSPYLTRRWNSIWGRVTDVVFSDTPRLDEPGSEMYDVYYEDGSVRRFYGKDFDENVAKQEHQLTPEYKEEMVRLEKARERSKEIKAQNEATMKSLILKLEDWLTTTNFNSMTKGRILKTLLEKVNYSGTINGILTRGEFVRNMVEIFKADVISREEPKYKMPSRSRWNNMSGDEQYEIERKLSLGETKTVYYIGGYQVTKIEYLYANYLNSNKE